jgi:hypothetical protein
MKNGSLFLLAIAWAALIYGKGYAAKSGPASRHRSPQTAAKAPSGDSRDTSLGSLSESVNEWKNRRRPYQKLYGDHISNKNLPPAPT